MARQVKRKKDQQEAKLPFTRQNYLIFGIGLVVLIIGFYAMSIGPWDSVWSLTIAPIVLVLAYLVIFPVAILYKKKKKEVQE